MLHYFARSFFNKHLISPYMVDSKTLNVFIVVDEIPIVESRSSGKGGSGRRGEREGGRKRRNEGKEERREG